MLGLQHERTQLLEQQAMIASVSDIQNALRLLQMMHSLFVVAFVELNLAQFHVEQTE